MSGLAFALALQLISPLERGAGLATKVEVAAAMAAAAAAQQSANNAASAIPVPGTGSPTAVVDNSSGTAGTAGVYAPFMHTHPSKARKGRVLIPVAGVLNVSFAVPFTTAAPVCQLTAEPTLGDTNVVNAQMDGQPTLTGLRIRITRTAMTNATLISLSILASATAQATYVHYTCLEP